MHRVWKVFNLWRRPPGVVVIMPFVAVPPVFVEKLIYESNWWIFAFEQEDPYVPCCCVNDEEVAAKSVVAFDDGFLWGCTVMEYFLEILGSSDEAEIHVK
jgi:hypothetical protein